MKDLPIEVIRAIKEVCKYLGEVGYSDVQITYLGTTKWLKGNDTPVVISPIALDMMLRRQQQTPKND